MVNNFSDHNVNSIKHKINSGYRFKKLKEIVSGKIKDLSNEPDIDKLDYQDFKFIPGDLITLQGRKQIEDNWRVDAPWKVTIVLDELIQIVQQVDNGGRRNQTWQKVDSDKIFFGDLYTRLDKNL